ncbi:hypothetical protein LXL04_028571 [Taraxacum kok-saghyz]
MNRSTRVPSFNSFDLNSIQRVYFKCDLFSFALKLSENGCIRALMRTSWTDLNPGRRFWGCPKPYSTCGFIGWIDGPMCERSKRVIPGLLRTLNSVERSLEKSKEETRKMKIYMFCSWVLFVAVLSIIVFCETLGMYIATESTGIYKSNCSGEIPDIDDPVSYSKPPFYFIAYP